MYRKYKEKKIFTIFFSFSLLLFLFHHFNINTSFVASSLRRVKDLSQVSPSQVVKAQILKLLPSFNSSYSPNPTWVPAIVLKEGEPVYHSLVRGEFEVMVENVRQILKYIEEWKSRREGSLEDYIYSRLNSGFLRIEELSLEGEILSFKLGGYLNLSVNIRTLSVERIGGMVLIPSYKECLDLSRQVERAYSEDEGAGMLMDVAMYWQEQEEGMWQALIWAERKKIRFLRQGEEPGFAIKFIEENPLVPATISAISESQWIGEFHPYDHPQSFFNLLNRLYYATFGANAFGVVDKEKTLEPACTKRSAEEFYQKIQALDNEGRLPQEIVIQEWGAGDGYSASVFLERIKELDEENGTDYYSRITYVLLDYSARVIEDLNQAPHLAVHKDRIKVFQADVLDLASLSGLKPALLIRANLLLNSLPIKIIEIRDGKVYEVEIRTYLDMQEDEVIGGYDFHEIKRAIQNGDISFLRRLGKPFFQRLKYVEELKEIEDIDSFPYAEYIGDLLERGFEGRLSLDIGAVKCLQNMLGFLAPGGIIQIADGGFTEMDKLSRTAGMFRYFGAIYHPVNFDFLESELPISLEVISQYRYAGDYAPRVIPVNNLLVVLGNFAGFRRYFNSETITPRGELASLSQELMGKYGGLNGMGLREFIRKFSDSPRKMFEWFENLGFITNEEQEVLYNSRYETVPRADELRIYEKICTQLKEIVISAEKRIETYEEAFLYVLYRIINGKAEEISKDRYIIEGENNHFLYILRVLGLEGALHAMWKDLEYFYPGISILNIQNL